MSPHRRLHRAIFLLTFMVTLLVGGLAQATESPAVQSVTLTERGRDLVLSADVDLSLNNQLEDAAERGLPLYFTAEVEITRPRWYWFDQTVLTATQTWRIVHNPLTHQWRVSSGSLALPVSSLPEALSVVRHVRNWRIADREQFKPQTTYEGRMRVRFDVSQLSKPFQVNALNSSDWSLSTPWTAFAVQVTPESQAPPVTAPAAPQPALPPTPSNGGSQPGLGLSLPDAAQGTGMLSLPPASPAPSPPPAQPSSGAE